MSLEELKKAILKAKEEAKKKPKPVSKPKVSTVESTVERRPRRRRYIREITSDQLRAVYFLLFGRTTRKSNPEAIREIIGYLKEVLEMMGE